MPLGSRYGIQFPQKTANKVTPPPAHLTGHNAKGGPTGHPSGFRAALLVVHLDLVLDTVVQLKIVVLQRGGAP